MSKNDGRTEKPTERRKRKARKDGRVARSADVGMALSMLVAVAWAVAVAPGTWRALSQGSAAMFASAGLQPSGDVVRSAALQMFTSAVTSLLVLAAVVGVAGGFAQTGLAIGKFGPKLERLDPRKTVQKLKPSAMGWEAARTLFKIAVLAAVLWGPLRVLMRPRPGGIGLDAWGTIAGEAVRTLLLRVAFLAAVIAAADFAMNKFKLTKSLRMTRQELKEEVRQQEGDPLIRAQRRRRQLEMSRNRMIADVAHADVVITNPTRFAVALKYAPGDAAPKVVAKGMDRLAAILRKQAYRHGVLVKSDPPLARALYRRCPVGSYVPAALYEAVAVVIAVAYRRRRQGAM